VHGDPAFHQYRPDTPRERDGKAVKYAMPVKVRMVLDAPLPTQHKLDDVSAPLWVTEAPIKADAIVSAGGTAVATFGVWGFKGRRPRGGASTMLPDWEWIALQGRTVYLVPDSDVASNKHVRDAVTRLGLALDSRGADVRYCYVPGTADGAKRGVDDYLAGGGTLDGLMETADDTPQSGSQAPGGNVAATLFRGADDRFTDARMAETVAHELLAGRFIWVAALGWLTWDGRRWADCSDVTVGEAVRAWTLERFKDAVTDLQAGKGDQAALDGWRNMLQQGSGGDQAGPGNRRAPGRPARRRPGPDQHPGRGGGPAHAGDPGPRSGPAHDQDHVGQLPARVQASGLGAGAGGATGRGAGLD
jgi:hypothetical protein